MAKAKLKIQAVIDLTCHNIFLLRLLNSVDLPKALQPELERARRVANDTIQELAQQHARLCNSRERTTELFQKLAGQIEERFKA
jgi:hypothetical protein